MTVQHSHDLTCVFILLNTLKCHKFSLIFLLKCDTLLIDDKYGGLKGKVLPYQLPKCVRLSFFLCSRLYLGILLPLLSMSFCLSSEKKRKNISQSVTLRVSLCSVRSYPRYKCE